MRGGTGHLPGVPPFAGHHVAGGLEQRKGVRLIMSPHSRGGALSRFAAGAQHYDTANRNDYLVIK